MFHRMNSPTLYSNKHKPLLSRRKQAHAMFLQGENLDAVMTQLDLKRATAHYYLYEARQMAAEMKDELLK